METLPRQGQDDAEEEIEEKDDEPFGGKVGFTSTVRLRASNEPRQIREPPTDASTVIRQDSPYAPATMALDLVVQAQSEVGPSINQSNSIRRSRPGAIAVSPTNTSMRPAGSPPTDELVRIGVLSAPFDIEQGLVEAIPVDDSALVHAHEVPISQRMAKQDLNRKCLGWCILAVLLLAGALGLIMSRRTRSDAEQTSPPTLSSYLALSQAPSSALTSSLEVLIQDLPDYTVQSLQKYGSPQWLALDWLSHHPDLNSLDQWRKKQLFALATLFYALDGPNWREEVRSRWLVYDVSECYWFSSNFGVFADVEGDYEEYEESVFTELEPDPCNDAGEFVNLRLRKVGTLGWLATIPSEIELLTSLEVLALDENHVSGFLSDFVPPQIYHMSSLHQLSIFGNELSGTIPTELLSMPACRSLYLDSNSLTGTIPTEIGAMSLLERLGLQLNLFTGSIPSEVTMVRRLQQFATAANPLTGTLPTELGTLMNAQGLDFSYSAHTGTIPSEFGALPSLAGLGLEGNPITGQIPSQLGQLPYLNGLALAKTGLTGTIPTELGAIQYLQGLYLGDTMLSGAMPSELGQLQELGVLDLSNMPLLSGSIPSELSTLNLQVLRIGGSNALSGTISETHCKIGSGSCDLDYWWVEFRFDTKHCVLEFDCTDKLCGCDCPCT